MAKTQFPDRIRVTVDMPSKLLDRVDREAEATMANRSDILRLATASYLDEREKRRKEK